MSDAKRQKCTIPCFSAASPGARLEESTYEDRPLSETEVEVEITKCGVCHTDIHNVDGGWRPDAAAPFADPVVAGHEIIGVVRSVGAAVTRVSVGQRVGIGPQRECCGTCEFCKDGVQSICPSILKTYLGAGNDKGGFARSIRMQSEWCFRVPDALSDELAAPLLCAGITTYAPLKKHVPSGGRVAVVGVGGLGHLAVQFARAMGFHVTGVSTSESKRADVLQLGAHDFVNSADAADMARLARSQDVVLSTVCGKAELAGYMALLKPRGVLCLLGLPDRQFPFHLDARDVILTHRWVTGSLLGPQEEYEEMLQFAADHGVKPQIERFALKDINVAFDRVRENKVRYRCVLDVAGHTWAE